MKKLVNNGNQGGRTEARNARIETWPGIKFFQGSPLPERDLLKTLVPSITVDVLREEKHVWRPEETIETSKDFFGLEPTNIQKPGLLVIGPPQSGKGTILFGLSEICDILQVGYVFIDGHHQETHEEIVAQTILKAQQLGIPIFFDSTDYLFLRSRKTGRSISLETQKRRVPIIMEAIRSVSVPIAMTFHDQEWQEEFLDLDLVSNCSDLFNSYPRYTIPTYLQSDASILRFLIDNGLPKASADYIINLPNLERVDEVLFTIIGQVEKVKAVLSGIRTYPVLKELVRNSRETVNLLINNIQKDDENALAKLLELIYNLEEKRKILTQIRRYKLNNA